MKTNDGRKLKLDTLAYLRKRTIALFKENFTRKELAELLGVNQNTVGNWVKIYKAHGLKGLELEKPGPKVGSGSRLTPKQERAARKKYS